MKQMKTEIKKSIIFWIMYLAYTSIYIARVNLSVAGPELSSLGLVDAAQLGLLGSAFSTVYALGRILNGRISDTAPPFKMLTVGLCAAGAANALASFFPPFWALALLWAANAYAQSMLWSSVMCVITAVYGKMAKNKMSLMVSSVATGNIVAIAANTWIITAFGVRFAFLIPGGITLIMGLFAFLSTKGIAAQKAEKTEQKSLFGMLKNKEILKMCIPSAFHGAVKENISLWMAVYVAFRYGVDLKTGAYYIMFIPVMGLWGRVLYPFILKLCGKKEEIAATAGFVVCIISAVLLCFKNVSVLAAVVALGAAYAAASVINTYIVSIFPLRFLKSGNTASASGIMDFAAYLGAGVSSALYGVVIKYFGYVPMFVSWAVICALSIFVVLKSRAK